MVAVQMADKNMVNTVAFNTISKQLHLCPLTAVYQKQLFIEIYHLRSWVTPIHRCRRTISQNQNFKFHLFIVQLSNPNGSRYQTLRSPLRLKQPHSSNYPL